MPDPIDELEGFAMSPVQPLPATEVRRRGDRIRRRNNALATVGGLAVVAAIVAPIAVLAGHDPASRSVQPAGQPHWQQAVPAGFDITAVPDGSPVRFEARADSVVDDFTLCGTPAFSTRSNDPAGPATDVVGASYAEPGTESSAARTLAVYADDETASRALDGLRSGVASCPEDKTGGTTYRWDTVSAPAVGEESLFIGQQVPFDKTLLSDLTLFEVVRVGNALLISSTHTSAGGQQAIDGTLPALTRMSAPVVDQMCVFSADGCASGSPGGS